MSQPPPAHPRHAVWAAAWPGLLLCSVLLLPFLGKAHTIDDVTFLLQAQHVLSDPWHPTAFEMVGDGDRVRLSSMLVTGPLMAWLLVPCLLLGGAEWAAHIAQWLLVMLAIVATARIAMRFGWDTRQTRVTGLLLASAPAVIGMATTSMSDIAAMAFGALAIERHVAWSAERRMRQGVVAALAFALAGLARTHALALPLIAMLVPQRDASRARGGDALLGALPLAVAYAVFFTVMRLTADPAAHHGSFLDAATSRLTPLAWRGNLAAFGFHWVLAVPLVLPWVWARARAMSSDRVVWIAFAASLALLLVGADPPMHPAMAVVTAVSFAVVVDIGRDAWRRDDGTQLLLGAWLLPGLLALAYLHLPCKVVLPSAPAAALLLAGLLRRDDARLPAAGAGAVVLLGATLGVLIVLADAEFADVGRSAAERFVAPQVRHGERVWYGGGWGSQWYAMRAGAQILATSGAGPQTGDYLVVSSATPGARPQGTAGLEALESLVVRSRFGRVMSRLDDVGFYSNAYGYLPWTWRNDYIERITTWRVRGVVRMPDAAPAAPPIPPPSPAPVPHQP